VSRVGEVGESEKVEPVTRRIFEIPPIFEKSFAADFEIIFHDFERKVCKVFFGAPEVLILSVDRLKRSSGSSENMQVDGFD
jgi:hypothetical protein